MLVIGALVVPIVLPILICRVTAQILKVIWLPVKQHLKIRMKTSHETTNNNWYFNHSKDTTKPGTHNIWDILRKYCAYSVQCTNNHKCLLVQVSVFELPGCSIIGFSNVCCTNVRLYKCPFFHMAGCTAVQLDECLSFKRPFYKCLLYTCLCTTVRCTNDRFTSSLRPFCTWARTLLRQHDGCRCPGTKMTTIHQLRFNREYESYYTPYTYIQHWTI